MNSAQTRPRLAIMKLNAERIVDVAMKICEEEGFEALSMRRLASAMQVTPMALYRHVPTKHELLNLIADRYVRSILRKPRSTLRWNDAIYQVYSSLRALMMKKPVLAHIFITQPLDGPAAYKLVEILVSILQRAGFEGEDTVEMCRVLSSFTVGFTMQDLAKKNTINSEDRRLQVQKLQEDATFRHIAQYWATWPSDRYFDSGLRALIDSYGRKRDT